MSQPRPKPTKAKKPKFKIGQSAYVPSSLLPNPNTFQHSLYRTKIQNQKDRKVTIDLPGGAIFEIASSKVHANVGIAIIEIGDLSTETTLLDPLATALHNFCRLIVDDSAIGFVKLRSTSELDDWWQKTGALFTHTILIGHGSKTDIQFLVNGQVQPNQLAPIFSKQNSSSIFISLCCETGDAAFSSAFSSHRFCSGLIAPVVSIHAASASQFTQTFLCWNLIEGKSTKVALKYSIKATAGAKIMKYWKKGKIQPNC